MRKEYNKRERGFSLIELMIVIAIIGVLAGVGIPAWRNATIAGNETAAIQMLKTIQTEQRTYFITKGRTGYGTFDQLIENGALDKRFAGEEPVVNGYKFTMKITPKTNSQPPNFTVNADPQQKEGLTATGKRHFYIDANVSSVRASTAGPATAEDSPEGGDEQAPAETK